MTRESLPGRRRSINVRIEHRGKDYDATFGFYPSGLVGEVFLDGAVEQRRVWLKVGSDMEGTIDDAATAISLLLQHGYRPADLLRRFTIDGLIRRVLEEAARLEAPVPA